MARLTWDYVGPVTTPNGFGFSGSAITRNDSGDYFDDGFRPGGLAYVDNAEDSANDGVYRVKSMSATVIVVEQFYTGAAVTFTTNSDDNTARVHPPKATPWRHVDADQFSFTSALREAARLTYLVYDLITGQNTPPITIDHRGPGFGARLNIPHAQSLEVSPTFVSPKSGIDPWFLYAMPVRTGPGQTQIAAEFDSSYVPLGLELRVYTLSGYSLVSSAPARLLTELGAPMGTYGASVGGLTAGTQYLIGLYAEDASIPFSVASGLRVYLDVAGRAQGLPADEGDLTGAGKLTLLTKAGAASAVVDDIGDLDDAFIADGRMVSAHIVDQLARTQTTLDEMICARPAFARNDDYTLTSGTTDVDPFDDPFWGPSQSLYANAPVFDCPVMGVALGAIPADGGGGGTGISGKPCSDWITPGLIDDTNVAKYCALLVGKVPDFDPAAGDIAAKVCVLVANCDGTVTGIDDLAIVIETRNESRTLLGTSTITDSSWSQVGSTDFWYVTQTVTVDPDQLTHFKIGAKAVASSIDKTNGDTLRIVGASVYFEAI